MRLSRPNVAPTLLLVALAAACGGDTTTPPEAEGLPPGPVPALAQVAMMSSDDGYGYSSHSFAPSTVTVRVAGTVQWSNSSGVAHNVSFAARDGAPEDVGDVASGSVSRTFAVPGEFSYTCTNHPGMAGRVIVE